VRPRTVAMVCGVVLAIGVVLWTVYLARQAIVWILVALFLTLALNPAVESLRARFFRRRGAAVAAVMVLTVAVLVGLGLAFIPPLVDQVDGFVKAAPGYLHDLTHGRGPLGSLERKYHLVEKARHAVNSGGASIGGGIGTVLDVTRGVITAGVGAVTVFFLTLFMLLDGPRVMDRLYALAPRDRSQRWRRVGGEVYRVIGGYVSGNLLISLIAGTATAVVLVILGVPYALALGLLVAILDLIPLAGATLAAVVVTLVALTQSVLAAVVVVVFFVLYQQFENHVLQPLVYGRTVQVSPLAALVSVLIGAEVAGVIGALGAIPVAGTIRVAVHNWNGAGEEV
jgi:predicted PurR-regulated permease PerM